MFGKVYDQTRGPDSQIPIWVDRIKDIDFKKVSLYKYVPTQNPLFHV